MMIVDLRSDTVTRPTADMRRAMAEAEVGDDVYGDDPTVNRLQELAAEMLGKEAGLFVASGSMGNQVAVMTHTQRGDEVLLDENSHIYNYEAGSLAVLSGVQPRTLSGDRGFLVADVIRAALRPADLHYPPTTLVCLENTHNRGGGTVMTEREMEDASRLAHERGLRVHLDGARIFNAAVSLGIPAARLARHCDSVMFCLSKGLASPVGSLLVSDRDWIERARKNRKIVGGGMRQAGVLAACGIVSLTRMVDRLAEDHEHARVLAEALGNVPGLFVNMDTVQTNIVMVDVARDRMSAADLAARMRAAGVLSNATGPHRVRLVTHNDVSRADVGTAIDRIAAIMAADG